MDIIYSDACCMLRDSNQLLLSIMVLPRGRAGSLPPQWSVLTNMLSFDLNRNQITGSLPGVWRHLDRLESLQLRNNQLVTTLPASWSSMQNLYFLDLSQNAQVTGRLPNLWQAPPPSPPAPSRLSQYAQSSWLCYRWAQPTWHIGSP